MEEGLEALWRMIVEMTPFLMLGFLCAGILHVAVPQKIYRRYLSENNLKSIFLASLFGIPLPLCSCGVLPTAMSLRKEGASKGATTAFLTATPQTGIDSILATYSVFGLAFTIIRPFAAMITSLFSGGLVAIFDKNQKENVESEDSSCCCEHHESKNKVLGAFQYGYVTMLQDIGVHLIVGLIVAGMIAILVPDSFLLKYAEYPALEMLAVTIIAIPMYVCATGSIPIAAALMLKGLTPGAALVFLMAGPAVSFASLMVVKKVMGFRTTLLYVLSIVVGSFAFGLFIDLCLPKEWFSVLNASLDCCATHVPFGNLILTIAFFVLLFNALIMKYTHKEHCHSEHVTKYKVEGLRCNHCKEKVEENLRKLSGVTNVDVDLSTGVVTLEGHVTNQEVKTVVESLGFLLVEN